MFWSATVTTQGDKKFFFDWYPTLNWLQSEIENWRVQFVNEAKEAEEHQESCEYLVACCERALGKAQKYFQEADNTPIVFAAVVLDPTKKMLWFEQLWQEGNAEQRTWPDEVLNKVKALWRSDYKPQTTTESIHSRPRATPASSDARRSGAASLNHKDIEDVMLERLHDFKRVKLDRSSSQVDALDEYLLQDPLVAYENNEIDVLHYWYTQRLSQPELAKFAFDTLALPLMSDDNERAFSAGRDLITYRRNGLKSDLIEASLCLRSFYGPPQPWKDEKGKEQPAFDDEKVIEKDYNKSQAIKRASEADSDVQEL